MARDLASLTAVEVAASFKRPVVFYEGEFVGGTLRLWNGIGDKTWNAQVWSGAGNLLGMTQVTESANVVAQSTTLSLTGMPSTLIALVELNAHHGLVGRVWVGFLDASDNVIADPYLAFAGRLDVPEIVDRGEECTISITYESRLVDLLRPRVRRYTHDDQQIEYPGDLGFVYVPSMQDQVLEW